MKRSPDVLFVCVHNAGRSQIAKALFNLRASERDLDLHADSAGTIPSHAVHPEVLQVMAELSIDLSYESGKLLGDELIDDRTRVITMGCQVDAEACPALPLDEVVDWGLPDPKGQPIDEVRRIRDEISERVDSLIDEILASANA